MLAGWKSQEKRDCSRYVSTWQRSPMKSRAISAVWPEEWSSEFSQPSGCLSRPEGASRREEIACHRAHYEYNSIINQLRMKRKSLSPSPSPSSSSLLNLKSLVLLVRFVLALSAGRPSESLVQVPNRHTVASIPGDLVLGILVPVHERPSPKQAQTRTCGTVREQYGIQRVEAAFRTIESINADPDILPNITLGIEIRDSCWHSPIALEQSIEFIRDAMAASEQTQGKLGSLGGLNLAPQAGGGQFGGAPNLQTSEQLAAANSLCAPLLRQQQLQQQPKKVKNIVGVVGPASSTDTVQVQNLLQLFNMPQVGYSATSRDLSNKNFFKYFLRVVPADKLQAQVMIDLMLAHNWTYVTVAYTEGSYGSSLMNAFRERAQEVGICFATLESMPPNADDAKFDELIEVIQKHPNARVVICMCEGRTVGKLFAGFKRKNITNQYLVVGSDGWSDRFDVVEKQEEFALGGISIRIHSAYVNDFDDYYFNLSPFTNHRNPWFAEFWETRFQCNLELQQLQQQIGASTGNGMANTRSGNQQLQQQQQQSPQSRPSFVRPPGAKVYNRSCTGRESLRNNHKQDSKMAFVQKSIITMALGLDSMQRSICPAGRAGLCPEMLPVNGSILLQHLMNVSFSFLDEEVHFDEQGDPPGKYEILNFQRRRGHYGPDGFASGLPAELSPAPPGRHPQTAPAQSDTLEGSDYSIASVASNISESLLAEKRRQNPLYDSYATLRVFHQRPRHAHAADQAAPRLRRARRHEPPQSRAGPPETPHPPASGYSSTSGYEYVHVGSWKSSDGLSLIGDIRWPRNGGLAEPGWAPPLEGGSGVTPLLAESAGAPAGSTNTLPKSVCSLPCTKGHAKKIQSDSVKCCWVCVPCRPNEYLFNEFKCKACEKGWWPNAEQTGCDQIAIQYFDWKSLEALAAIAIALLGLSLTLATGVVFIMHNDTPVVKSTTRELSYMILFSMFLAYINTFFLIAKPRKETCFVTRVLPGFAFAMMYGALVTKTNRIARILAGSKKKIITRRPRFMSATSQMVITWIIVAVECLIIMFMLIREPADKMHDYPSDDRVVLVCNTTTMGIIVPLGFDFFLIAMCTLYAFKTRNVPENFNEAKFIGFTMYTTLVIWVAFVAIYLSSDHKVTTLCLCISFSALFALILLFFPRCYIIIFKSEKNNRSFFTTTKNVRCHFGYQIGSTNSHLGAAQTLANQSNLATAANNNNNNSTNYLAPNNSIQQIPEIKNTIIASLASSFQGEANYLEPSEAQLGSNHKQAFARGLSSDSFDYSKQQFLARQNSSRSQPLVAANNRLGKRAFSEQISAAELREPKEETGAQVEPPRSFFAALIALFSRRSRRKECNKVSSIQQHLRAIRHAENLDRQTHFRRSQVQRLVQRFDSMGGLIGAANNWSASNQLDLTTTNSQVLLRAPNLNQRQAYQFKDENDEDEDEDNSFGLAHEQQRLFLALLNQLLGSENVWRLNEAVRRYWKARGTNADKQLALTPSELMANQMTATHNPRRPLNLSHEEDQKLALTLLKFLLQLVRDSMDELTVTCATAKIANRLDKGESNEEEADDDDDEEEEQEEEEEKEAEAARKLTCADCSACYVGKLQADDELLDFGRSGARLEVTSASKAASRAQQAIPSAAINSRTDNQNNINNKNLSSQMMSCNVGPEEACQGRVNRGELRALAPRKSAPEASGDPIKRALDCILGATIGDSGGPDSDVQRPDQRRQQQQQSKRCADSLTAESAGTSGCTSCSPGDDWHGSRSQAHSRHHRHHHNHNHHHHHHHHRLTHGLNQNNHPNQGHNKHDSQNRRRKQPESGEQEPLGLDQPGEQVPEHTLVRSRPDEALSGPIKPVCAQLGQPQKPKVQPIGGAAPESAGSSARERRPAHYTSPSTSASGGLAARQRATCEPQQQQIGPQSYRKQHSNCDRCTYLLDEPRAVSCGCPQSPGGATGCCCSGHCGRSRRPARSRSRGAERDRDRCGDSCDRRPLRHLAGDQRPSSASHSQAVGLKLGACERQTAGHQLELDNELELEVKL